MKTKQAKADSPKKPVVTNVRTANRKAVKNGDAPTAAESSTKAKGGKPRRK